MQAMEVSCKELRQRAWNRLGNDYWRSFGASVVGGIVGCTGWIFTQGPMVAGVTKYYIKQQRGEDTEFGEIFSQFENYGVTFVGNLLKGIILFLWALIPLVGIVFGGFIKPLEYSQMFYFMMDEDIDASDSIAKSKEMMLGYRWKLLKLVFSFIGWYLLAIVTLGIGFLFLMPYLNATMAEFYAELIRCHDEAPETSADDQGEQAEQTLALQTPHDEADTAVETMDVTAADKTKKEEASETAEETETPDKTDVIDSRKE